MGPAWAGVGSAGGTAVAPPPTPRTDPSGPVPALNQYMELVPLPEGPLRPALARTMALNAAGVVAWEQALRFAFQRTPH